MILSRFTAGIAVLLMLAASLPLAAQSSSPVQASQSSAPQSPEDKAIEQQLRAVLAEVASFKEVRVTVRSGVVTLSGKVSSSSVRDSSENIAKSLPKVVYVSNLIELPPPDENPEEAEDDAPSIADQRLTERLRGILARFENLASVSVEVVAGVAELRGEVIDPSDRDKAEQLAKSIDGIVFVSNLIEESVDISERILPSVEKMVSWVRGLVVGLPLLLIAILVGILFLWIGRRVAKADKLFTKLSDKKLVQDVLRQVLKTMFLLIGIYLALEILGATALVGAILGTAGVVGLALGFAFRDIVENYLASIILSFRQPFRSKDLVEIDGKLGTVIRMTTRETVLLTSEGNHLSIPNAAVFKSTIVNFTRAPRRRFDVAVGVGTDVELNLATSLGLGVLRDMAGVIDEPPPYARVEALGDSSVMLRFYGWVDQRHADYSKAKSAAVRLIKGVMDDHSIDMPVPMYQIDIRKPQTQEDSTKVRPDKSRSAEAQKEAESADVSPDRQIEDQVEEELRDSGEVDLLEDKDGGSSSEK